MKYLIALFIASSIITGCSSTPKKEVKFLEPKMRMLEAKKAPTKPKFLDYIYQIRPDHKEPGYSINSTFLSDGYAYGEGPYDGWGVEFFLFRGKSFDLVLEKFSGPEGDITKMKYGSIISAYTFKDGKMKQENVETILPIKNIEALYKSQTEKMKKDPQYKDWNYTELIRLPIEGTIVEYKICQGERAWAFQSETNCITAAQIKWDKTKFTLTPVKTPTLSKENI